jgi:hypothetical protein
MNQNFRHSDVTYGILNDQNVKSVFNRFITFDVLFDVLIFDVLIKYFYSSDLSHFGCSELSHFGCSDALIHFLCSFGFSRF